MINYNIITAGIHKFKLGPYAIIIILLLFWYTFKYKSQTDKLKSSEVKHNYYHKHKLDKNYDLDYFQLLWDYACFG
jgi:hypothetical protein